MALIHKNKNPQVELPFEKQNDIKKLYLYFTIVNLDLSNPVANLFNRLGANVQMIQHGRGTATKQIRDILGIEENRKDIVISIVREEILPDVESELGAFFLASKRNRGIGFAIPLTSIIGVQVYKLLTDTL